MKIRFLGTGAAEGVPAMFCGCENCINIRKLGEAEYRTRSQVLIDEILSIDFPPEAYSHSLKNGILLSKLKYLLVTHSHMDHFYAHDFILRGYKYAMLDEDVLEIYGNAEVGKVFAECTAREMKPEVKPHVSMNVIKPYQVFTVGEYEITTIPANHGKTEDVLLYCVSHGGKSYLHFYDTGRVSDAALEFLAQSKARVNLVAFDCTFGNAVGGENSRHMGIEDCMIMKRKLLDRNIIDSSTKIVVTHFSHNCNPTRANLSEIERKYNVFAAYDGLEMEI